MAEELGRAIAPVPVSSSLYLAAEFLLQAGTEAQKQAWLPKLASGEAVGAFAFVEGQGRMSADKIHASVKDGKLSGVKTPVADGDCADVGDGVRHAPGAQQQRLAAQPQQLLELPQSRRAARRKHERGEPRSQAC